MKPIRLADAIEKARKEEHHFIDEVEERWFHTGEKHALSRIRSGEIVTPADEALAKQSEQVARLARALVDLHHWCEIFGVIDNVFTDGLSELSIDRGVYEKVMATAIEAREHIGTLDPNEAVPLVRYLSEDLDDIDIEGTKQDVWGAVFAVLEEVTERFDNKTRDELGFGLLWELAGDLQAGQL